jgi:DNA-directed RNA polymerase specialized sigma subunit
MAKLMIEPDLEPAWNQWRNDESPASNKQFLGVLAPKMDKAISAHVGQASPVLRSNAKRIAIESMRRYDPTQSSVGTYLYRQLAGLKRLARRQSNILRVPERLQLGRTALRDAESELLDRHGRDPSDSELADHLGMSMKRIELLRRASHPVAEGTAGQLDGFQPEALRKRNQTMVDLLYDDLDPIDQRIVEHSFGMRGRKVLPNNVLAHQLRLSPGAISQRRARIQARLDVLTKGLNF